VPYKEKQIEKKYYTIGEVAEKFGVATSLIRFWEAEFDIIRPRKGRKGNRQFTAEDIENVKLIFHLVKEKGYTLHGAKDVLKEKKGEAINQMKMISALKNVKSLLQEIKNKLP